MLSASHPLLDLDGLAAVIETHFRYEERQLLRVLDGLEVHDAVSDALGPLS